MLKTLRTHAMALAAMAIAATSLTVMSFGKVDDSGKLLAPVSVYFTGNVNDAAQVANPSNWSENNPNPSQTCDGANQACSMEVEDTDLQGPSGNRTLDPLQISLRAEGSSSTGYRPEKDGGSSNTEPIIHNKN